MATENKCFFCDNDCVEKCGHCNLVGYCTDEHFRVHRPGETCFPFIVKSDPYVGRYMVASRDIKATELILYDQALAIGPKIAGTSIVCLQCLKRLPSDYDYQCSQCKWRMCNAKCENGLLHQRECESLTKLPDKDASRPRDQYKCITPLRLLLNRKQFSERFKLLDTLMDHSENRRKDPVLWNHYQKYVNDMIQNCCLDVTVTDEEIDRAVGLLWTHSFSCSNAGGQAIFPIFSILSHSCSPNASPVVVQDWYGSASLEAKVDINKGDEITISYLSVLQGRVKRRRKLREKWFFDCNCKRCADPTDLGSHMSTIKCIDEDCQGLVMAKCDLDEDSICNSCGKTTIWEAINDIETNAARSFKEVVESNASVAAMEDFLDSLASKFHEKHYLPMLAKKHIIGMYGDDLMNCSKVDLERRLFLCDEAIELMDTIDPGRSMERGVLLRDKAETQKLLLKKKRQEDEIGEEDFMKQVRECIQLLSESQECMSTVARSRQ